MLGSLSAADPYTALVSSALGTASGGPSSAQADSGSVLGDQASTGGFTMGGIHIGSGPEPIQVEWNHPGVWVAGAIAAVVLFRALK